MAPGLRRSSFSSSELIRLLAEFAAAEVHGSINKGSASSQSFAQRLGLWLNWTDAITLSATLAAPLPSGKPAAAATEAAAAKAAIQACQRLRASLVQALERAAAQLAEEVTPADFAPLRRHYQAQQRALENAISPLRAQLRATLAGLSPTLSRLAALDAVLDNALAARERALLATVVTRLEERHAKLRKAFAVQQTMPAAVGAGQAVAALQSAAWLDDFCKDMHSVLLAELELRLQPALGLLDALRLELNRS